jgi:hypothetical protein
MITRKEIINTPSIQFSIVKFIFNSKNDSKIIAQFKKSGEELAQKLNPVLARDSSKKRNYNKVLSNAIAGQISESCWKDWINKIAIEKKKSLILSSTDIDEKKNQIDIIIDYGDYTKNAEVRSSFPYAGLENAIIKNFDIIGWYCNAIKLDEVKKDYYLRALFPFHVDEFNQKLNEGFDVYLCGGASKQLLEESPYAKDKEFIPYDEVSFENIRLTKYRVIEPIINGYDTDIITEIIVEST